MNFMYNFYNYVIVVTVSPLPWPLMSDTDHIKKLEANRLTPLPKKGQIQDFKLGVLNTDATDIIWKIDAISERWQQMKTEKSHGQTYLIWKKVKLAGAFLVWVFGVVVAPATPLVLPSLKRQIVKITAFLYYNRLRMVRSGQGVSVVH